MSEIFKIVLQIFWIKLNSSTRTSSSSLFAIKQCIPRVWPKLLDIYNNSTLLCHMCDKKALFLVLLSNVQSNRTLFYLLSHVITVSTHFTSSCVNEMFPLLKYFVNLCQLTVFKINYLDNMCCKTTNRKSPVWYIETKSHVLRLYNP